MDDVGASTKSPKQHRFDTIVGATRQLTQILRNAGPIPGVNTLGWAYKSAVHHEAGKLASVVRFWFTRDPKMDINVPDEENEVALLGCYRGRNSIQSAALRLWEIFYKAVQPQLKAAAYEGRLPLFDDSVLTALEHATEVLDQVIGQSISTGSKPDTRGRGTPEASQPICTEPIDREQIAELLLIARSTLRKPEWVKGILPRPVRPHCGRNNAIYSYRELRASLLRKAPRYAGQLPESYHDAMDSLARRPVKPKAKETDDAKVSKQNT